MSSFDLAGNGSDFGTTTSVVIDTTPLVFYGLEIAKLVLIGYELSIGVYPYMLISDGRVAGKCRSVVQPR